MAEKNKPVVRYALAGQIVSTPQHARMILRRAIIQRMDHLVPQARSVLRRLEAAAAERVGT